MGILVMTNIDQSIIDDAFKNTNFGRTDYRQILLEGVEKTALNYHNGWTLTQIIRKLGLGKPNKDDNSFNDITKEGLDFIKHEYAELTLKRNGGEPTLSKSETVEAVAWMLPNNDGYDCLFRDNATKISCKDADWSNWTPLYTQPQTVADALEQAAKICDDMGDEAQMKYDLTKSNYYEGAADQLDIASQAIRALITNPTQEAQGWKLVPIEATSDQLNAAADIMKVQWQDSRSLQSKALDIYKAMIDSAPTKGE